MVKSDDGKCFIRIKQLFREYKSGRKDCEGESKMELSIKKDAVAACELLLDSAAEQTVECDVLLPDYCPDIVRVLCCGIDAAVTDCRINKTTLTVDGTANVDICYMAEVGGVKRVGYSVPFSKSFELKVQPKNPIWAVNVRQGHTNCRAASKRRAEGINGAIRSARSEKCVHPSTTLSIE